MAETIRHLGEFGLIRAITDRLSQAPQVLVGPGDDAAVIRTPDARVIATTDVLVEGRHFRREWSSAYDVGRKAAAQNLADVAAMGGSPSAVLVALVAPGELAVSWVLGLFDGIRDECDLAGASVAGGDCAGGEAVTIAVTALGDLRGREPVGRSGARPGDVVALAGRLGWAAAGLALLESGRRSPEALIEAHRRPAPPYAAGPAAAGLGATALIDVSDGLVQDLGHIAAASRVRIAVDSAALDPGQQVAEAGRLLGVSPLSWVVGGGEDHAFVATFPTGTALPATWRVIGRVEEAVEVAVEDGEGVLVDGVPIEGGAVGYDHFAR